MRTFSAAVLTVLAATLVACSSSPGDLGASEEDTAPNAAERAPSPDAGPSASSRPDPVAAGESSNAETIARNAVVLLQRIESGDDGQLHIATCTGVLVAPNLVVTAHHCVATKSTEPTVCTLPGSDVVTTMNTLTGNVDATGVLVSRSADRIDADEGSRLLRCDAVDAVASRIVDDGTMTMCDGHDVAWLILDRPIALPAYPPIRQDAAAVGEPLQGYGWGRVSVDGPLTRTLKATRAEVLAPESSSYPEGGCVDGDGERGGAVGFGEVAEDGECFPGDSGGPVFDGAGRLVAVRSRHATASGSCLSVTKSARVAAYPEAMQAAFAEASSTAAANVPKTDPGSACR